jgi:ST7 protein
MWHAFEEPSKKKRISMAKKALQISADCADAYVLLAEDRAKDFTEAAEFYRKGIAAGRRALGDTAIKNLERDFWTDYETRPFMRAVDGLATERRA